MNTIPILEMAKHVKMKSSKEIVLLLRESAQSTSAMNPFPQISVMNSEISMIKKTYLMIFDMPAEVKSQLLRSLMTESLPNDVLKMILTVENALVQACSLESVLVWNKNPTLTRENEYLPKKHFQM